MWLFILATWYCEDLLIALRYIPNIYPKFQYLCEANGKDALKYWYKMSYCYNELQPNSKHIFDYCECRVPKTGEKYYYGESRLNEYLFCYNYTKTPQSTPKLKVQSARIKKPKTVLSIFYQIILFE